MAASETPHDVRDPAEILVGDGWPSAKLIENLFKLAETEAGRDPPSLAILVTTGALNPIHRGHVAAMEATKQFLEKERGMRVLAGWISPSHDSYVGPKMRRLGERAFPTAIRLKCAELAVKDSDWLAVGTWESDPAKTSWPDFPIVLKALSDSLARLSSTGSFGNDDTINRLLRHIQIHYVCGSDHLSNISPSFAFGIAVIGRTGQKLDASLKLSYEQLEIVQPAGSSLYSGMSSTKVRSFLARGLVPSTMLPQEVGEYLGDHISRVLFISASYLVKFWRELPPHIHKTCLLFFGSRRCWLFPSSPAQIADRNAQPTDYGSFSPDFLAYVEAKEKLGHVYFLKPDDPAKPPSFELVSQWLESLVDPVTGTKYGPLILDPAWWKAHYSSRKGLTRRPPTVDRVILNFLTGDHDYEPTLELLAQSNPTLIPALAPADLQPLATRRVEPRLRGSVQLARNPREIVWK